MTILLSRAEVADLLTLDDCIDAVENAFRLLGEGRVDPPAVATVHADGGAFHVKAARMGERFAAKINGNFGLAVPRIKGVIVLADATDGKVLAVLDSIEITTLRTAAATAVAAKKLARADARTLLVIGCGNQGRIHVRALRRVHEFEAIYAMDADPRAARALADECGARVVAQPVEADVVVTCTPSTSPILENAARGTFIAGVGADSSEKHEIAAGLMSASKVITDVTEQCERIGDLHHALAAGALSRGDVHAELGEVVAGVRPGRESDDEIIVFDSTGMALQDVASAAIVYERAVARQRGLEFAFG